MMEINPLDTVIHSIIKNMNMVLYSVILVFISIAITIKAKKVFDTWFKTEYINPMNGVIRNLETAIKTLTLSIAGERAKTTEELSEVKERIAAIEGSRK